MRLKLNRHISSISRKELDARIYSDLSKHSIYTNKILRDKEARTSVQNEIFMYGFRNFTRFIILWVLLGHLRPDFEGDEKPKGGPRNRNFFC